MTDIPRDIEPGRQRVTLNDIDSAFRQQFPIVDGTPTMRLGYLTGTESDRRTYGEAFVKALGLVAINVIPGSEPTQVDREVTSAVSRLDDLFDMMDKMPRGQFNHERLRYIHRTERTARITPLLLAARGVRVIFEEDDHEALPLVKDYLAARAIQRSSSTAPRPRRANVVDLNSVTTDPPLPRRAAERSA